MKKLIKKLIKLLFLLSISIFAVIFICNWQVEQFAKKSVYYDLKKIPYNNVGLLLGTNKRVKSGRINLYFKYRINAAVKIYNSKKIKYILVSGDNTQNYYNETRDMKKELMKKGVPEHAIILDDAGIRTLDSVVRAKEIFGQKNITIISQKFQNKRAIYIADAHDIKAIGFNARDPLTKMKALRVKIREAFARVKVFIDLYILNTRPKFQGKKIIIPASL
ncbi:MAG: vancomycin high temperature exclusion protein [bacterium]|nr:vancomycin high temperature exclusion protein [bacterium]